ncbi:Replication factor A protein 1 [Aspergillus melleus]|uniref:Replication factor A protein 1 n=1 Tax=Aspergillus melleus TaxID=138277 RepID=A0ACC3BCG8_9EURO|nr:Replication factor A protein 1 [Aspergillus melleus]
MASEAASQISVGALSAIFDETKPQFPEPIVQCVQIKPLPPQQNHAERYRAVFSDISNYVQTMLATQANPLVTSGLLRKGCFVKLKAFQANSVKGKKILIILDLEVLQDLGEAEKIGEPKPLESKSEEEDKPQPTTISSHGFYGSSTHGAQMQGNDHTPLTRPSVAPGHATIYPIEAISPYAHKWTIKARCTSKSNIKTWHNRNGEGKLFSVNLLDDSGEIRATGFNDQCDMLYNIFQEGSVYYISSPCRVQIAKKQFTNLNNDYELTFERDTIVEKAEDQSDVPQVRFNFTIIGDLQSVEKDSTIDVIGVLKEVGETSQIVSKTTNKPYNKRELTLVDNTGFSVRLTIWGSTAMNFDAAPESVVAFKGVKVSDFGGRSLSLLSSGSMTVDPDIEEAHKLKGWYDAQGRAGAFTSHASMLGATTSTAKAEQFKTVAQVREEQLGMSDDAVYFSLKATVIYIKQDNMCYPACLSEGCNKKVTELDPGQWRCERCDKTYPKPEYRYIMLINVSDHTGHLWLNCFDEVGRSMMGAPADHLMQLRQDENEKTIGDIFQDANCRTWNFRCRAKIDYFGDQQRIRYQISSAKPINYSEEASRLAHMIESYGI